MSFCIIAYLDELGQDMSVKFHPGAGDVFQLSVSELGAQEYLSHAIRGHRPTWKDCYDTAFQVNGSKFPQN